MLYNPGFGDIGNCKVPRGFGENVFLIKMQFYFEEEWVEDRFQRAYKTWMMLGKTHAHHCSSQS